jgi:hypothetical protein
LVSDSHHSAKLPSGPNWRPCTHQRIIMKFERLDRGNILKRMIYIFYLIIESVREFVPNNPTDGAIV